MLGCRQRPRCHWLKVVMGQVEGEGPSWGAVCIRGHRTFPGSAAQWKETKEVRVGQQRQERGRGVPGEREVGPQEPQGQRGEAWRTAPSTGPRVRCVSAMWGGALQEGQEQTADQPRSRGSECM